MSHPGYKALSPSGRHARRLKVWTISLSNTRHRQHVAPIQGLVPSPSYREAPTAHRSQRSPHSDTKGKGPALDQPFTHRELALVASLLQSAPEHAPGSFPPHTASFTSEHDLAGSPRRASGPKEAAVLIPLLNVAGRPHVLLEVRATKMRTHAGEVSFPGGRIDPTDASVVDAALRESHEELDLSPANVQILGALDVPEYALGNRSRVWAVVGFLHSGKYDAGLSNDASHGTDPDTPLPSFDLTQLTPSPDEVAHIVPMPLSYLASPHRLAMHLFRIDARRPYWKVGVGDLVPEALLPPVRARRIKAAMSVPTKQLPPGSTGGAPQEQNEGDTDPHRITALEVWGLSGWFLNKLAWSVGWMQRPEPLAEPED